MLQAIIHAIYILKQLKSSVGIYILFCIELDEPCSISYEIAILSNQL